MAADASKPEHFLSLWGRVLGRLRSVCQRMICISATLGRGTRRETRRGRSQKRSESHWQLWRKEGAEWWAETDGVPGWPPVCQLNVFSLSRFHPPGRAQSTSPCCVPGAPVQHQLPGMQCSGPDQHEASSYPLSGSWVALHLTQARRWY